MAPEVIARKSRRVSGRDYDGEAVDVWAIAVMVFNFLTDKFKLIFQRACAVW